MTAVAEAIAGRRFDVRGVSKHLDALNVDDLRILLGEPRIQRSYAEPVSGYRDDGTWGPLWMPGDGRPALAPDAPSVAQAMGRCAAAAIRRELGEAVAVRGVLFGEVGAVHPSPCGWCGLPLGEVLKALAWTTWSSRYVVSELAVWDGEAGSWYARPTRSDYYENPVYATFFEDWTPEQRRNAIERAANREMAAMPA